MKRLLLSLFLFSLSLPSFAKSTIVEVSTDMFPYGTRVSLYLNEGSTYIECQDEYLKTDMHVISDLEELKTHLQKSIRWVTLNKEVKADIKKHIGSFFTLHGMESGDAFVHTKVNSVTVLLNLRELKYLLKDLDSNLEKATREEAKNKEDLFN
jgi:hypothetical protein